MAGRADAGWNCERANGSVRSSFDTTINVLEGLLGFERATGGTATSRAARAGGEEFLLARDPDPRLVDAIDHIGSRQRPDGT